MRIRTLTTTFSIESGDDNFYHRNSNFTGKLLLNCEDIKKCNELDGINEIKEVSFLKYKLRGKVIFCGEYLLIIQNTVNIGIVLNNEFKRGNTNQNGNKNIDHTGFKVDDLIEVIGTFKFSSIHFCVFTHKKSESQLPDVDFLWNPNAFYHIKPTVDKPYTSFIFSDFEEVNQLESISNSFDDYYILEFDLVNEKPIQIDQKMVGSSGFFRSICWITKEKWIINCEGLINSGVKSGDWFYIDKSGQKKIEINYDVIK